MDKVPDDRIDAREQLFNDREVGPAHRVQVSTERVAVLHGVMLDLDADKIKEGEYARGMAEGPEAFYERTVKLWLDRNPVLADAEVRSTGTGLHVLIWLAEPLVFATDGQRQRWAGIVQAVQAVLPVDPDQPGITALTRPVGGVNGKNGATVTRLKEGRPVPIDWVEDLFDRILRASFRTVMKILLGTERATPCPVCRTDGTSLAAMDYVGKCYGACGTVKLGRLYEVFLLPRKPVGNAAADVEKAVKTIAPTERDAPKAALEVSAGAEAVTEGGSTDERR